MGSYTGVESKGDAFGILLSSPIFEGVDQKIIVNNEEFIADIAWDACPGESEGDEGGEIEETRIKILEDENARMKQRLDKLENIVNSLKKSIGMSKKQNEKWSKD